MSEMTDAEVVAHLRAYVDSEFMHHTFSWPTDACGYKQHIRFVRHRNDHWDRDTDADWRKFVLDYADALERGDVPPYQERPIGLSGGTTRRFGCE